MKTFRIIAVAFAAAVVMVGVSSCEKFLEEDSRIDIPVGKFYETTGDYFLALYGTHKLAANVYFGDDFFSVTDLVCDDAEFWSTNVSKKQLSRLTFDIRNTTINNVWKKFYAVIANANYMLYRIEQAEKKPNGMNILKAECMFLRAWSHFNLVQLFGEIPIKTSPDLSIYNDIQPHRNSVDDVYRQIVSDLIFAKQYLPANRTKSSEIGKAEIVYTNVLTTAAANTLLAKVYLTQPARDYNGALRECKAVMDDSNAPRGLCPNYSWLFTTTKRYEEVRLKEVIWEFESKATDDYRNSSHRNFAPGGDLGGLLYYIPTTSIFTAYKPGDLRYKANYRFTGAVAYMLKKIDVAPASTTVGAPIEVVLRYADVLLMYAEALNELGFTFEAEEYVNQIRNRAEVRNIVTGLSQDLMRDSILHERRLEFAHEGHRLYDLRRYGRYISTMVAYNRELTYFEEVKQVPVDNPDPAFTQREVIKVPFSSVRMSVEQKHVLHPMPYAELVANPKLVQNTGWSAR